MSSSGVSTTPSSPITRPSQPQPQPDATPQPPQPQPYWHHNGTAWLSSSTSTPKLPTHPPLNPQTLRLISWNIDFQQPFGAARMTAALTYLNTLVTTTPKETPLVIFLQEMTASDLALIKKAPWIQERFYVTDITTETWLEPIYGTTTMVDRRLCIRDVFRVPWYSNFSRDGLFVDVGLTRPLGLHTTPSTASDDKTNVLRLCNTHLESLVAVPPIRPHQLAAASPYLHATRAALIAGDFNAIEAFDRTLADEHSLQDAYVALGGREDSNEGYTWGIQVPAWLREKFGCSRMDKMLYAGEVRVVGFERVGIDVKVEEGEREAIREAGMEEWVTDHFGIMGDFELGEGWRVVGGEEDVRSKLA